MIIDIPRKPDDDPEILAAVCSLLATGAREANPTELFAIRVDNWFDHKWLRFSGKGRVEDPWWVGVSLDRTTALDTFRQEKLTFPPFTPNRIIEEHYWKRESEDAGHREQAPRPVHASDRQHSARNLQRRINQFSPSGLFAWFSSQSRPNGQASVMVYLTQNEGALAWYASFRKKTSWQLGQVKGIDRSKVEALLPFGSSASLEAEDDES